jgi:type IV pilus assembly protein PilB
MRERARIGEILVAAGVIDERQLDAALGEQARWGKRIGVTLIKMGMVEEAQLIRGLAMQLDLPVARLAGKRIAPEVIALVPARLASEHGVIPLFTRGEGRDAQLYLGMEDPSNIEVLDDLGFRTGLEIQPVMMGPSEIGEAIDRYYHGRRMGGAATDPFASGDTLDPASLRVVTDEGTRPEAALDEDCPIDPDVAVAQRPARVAETLAPTRERLAEVEGAASAGSPGEALDAATVERLQAEIARLEGEVSKLRAEAARAADDAARAAEDIMRATARAERVAEESERTRVVAKALTQLLIEAGHLTLEAIQSRTVELKHQARPRDGEAESASGRV